MLSSFFDINFIKSLISSSVSVIPGSLALLFLMVITIVVINVFLLAIFGLVGAAFLRRMHIASGSLEQQKQQAHEKAEALLENARKESLRLVDGAGKKAGEVLAQTQVVKEALEAQLTRAIQEFSQKETDRVGHIGEELVIAYRAMIESSKQQYSDVAGAVTKEMASDAQRSIKQFGEFLKDQTTHYEGTLKQQAQEGFMSAQKEISDYKRESLRHVEDAIYLILNLVAKSVLGKVLSLEDQQDLIIHALNEAKQQGFFEV